MLKNRILFLDTETTGLVPGYHDAIQIAGIIEENNNIIDEFKYKSRPFNPENIDDEALKINGFTKSELLFFPDSEHTIECLIYKLRPFIIEKNILFAGQKTFFDLFFMQALFQKSKYEECRAFNIMQVSHNATMDLKTLTLLAIIQGHKIKSNSLADVCEYLGVKNEKPHDALSDLHATRECFKKFEVVLKNQNLRWWQK